MALLSSLFPRKNRATKEEERRSFGIGGAGNIRTRDQAIVQDAYDLVERRRSRAGSSSTQTQSLTGKRASRRSSSISETLKHVFSRSSK
ncbi:hypothetical protein F4859DRAFT_491897 [Xylaria cf. heliscus]|nr:hypothetical protein F4859DRAFT_491897 [Xylaria cf. heliscus]